MRDFRIFHQVRRTTSLKRNGVSAILFQRKRSSKLKFWAFYLLRFSAVYNTSKYWRTLSACHRAKCAIFGFFVKFDGRRRWNETGYWRYCFSAKRYQNCFLSGLFAAIFCCLQHIEILTNSVSTTPGEMRDFRIFRQVRGTTSFKSNTLSAIMF